MLEHKDEILATVRQAKGVEVADITDADIMTVPVYDSIPLRTDADGDIKPTWEWFSANFTQLARIDGYNVACLHITDDVKKKWGISGVNGTYRNDPDDVFEFFMVANKGEYNWRNRCAEFVRLFLHELGHGFMRWSGGKNALVHLYDYTKGDIKALFPLIDFTRWSFLRRKLTLLRQIAELLTLKAKQPQTLYKRLPDPFNEYISQDYGVPNERYTLTGIHIGIDYATPLGTPVYAPWDGAITHADFSGELGYYCHFRYTFEGITREERYCHLKRLPAVGPYKRGATVAYTGATGNVTGPHLHVDGWWDRVRIEDINRDNWSELTYNPHIS